MGEVLLIIDIVQSHSRPEHVHLLLSVPPDLAPSRVMQAIKGKTSYFVATSGNVTDDVIKKDIELPGAEPQDDDRFGSAISLHPRGEAVRRLQPPANPPPQSVRAASASASAIAAASG